MSLHRGLQLGDLGLPPDEARGRGAQIPRTRIQRPQRRKVRAQARRLDLEHLNRSREIPQPARSKIDEINTAQQTRRRLGQQDLTTMSRGHHSCGSIEHRSEVVPVSQLGLAGCQSHSHRQLQLPFTADIGDAKAATKPSPVWPNKNPSYASIAVRNTLSWTTSAARIPSASVSHRRVEPSTSVNRNVTTPEGAAAAVADTPAECHIRHAGTLHMREPDPETPGSYWHTDGDLIKLLLG